MKEFIINLQNLLGLVLLSLFVGITVGAIINIEWGIYATLIAFIMGTVGFLMQQSNPQSQQSSQAKPNRFNTFVGIVLVALIFFITIAFLTKSLAWSISSAAVFFVLGLIGLIAKELNLQSQ